MRRRLILFAITGLPPVNRPIAVGEDFSGGAGLTLTSPRGQLLFAMAGQGSAAGIGTWY